MEAVWTSKYLTGRSEVAIRNRALLGLMIDTGLRRGEIVGLTLADVGVRDHLLTVTGKGNKQRRILFSTSVHSLIQQWPELRGY